MTLHMGVVAVASPLLALGVAGGRLDPARTAPRLFSAIPAAAVERAIAMSHDKYCSASIMLGKTAQITTGFEVIED